MGNYYENAHNIMRYPNNNQTFEQRVSMHYEQMQFHNQIINRSLSMVENAMSQLVLNAPSSTGRVPVRPRAATPAATSYAAAAAGAATPAAPSATINNRRADVGGRPQASRVSDNLIQEMVESILAPPQRRQTPSLYSLFSSGFGPSLGTGIYGFDATIQIEPAENLTRAEVEQYTELVEYHAANPDMTETRCPITYEDFAEGEQVRRIRHCHHYFKDSAITGWLRNTRGSCPVCRHVLQDLQPNVD